MTLQFNEMIPARRYLLAYDARYLPTWRAEGNTGVFSGQARSEKQFVCFDRFVRIEGRHNCEFGDHNPPTDSFTSNTRGYNPASTIALAEARPEGPAPISVSNGCSRSTYDGNCLQRIVHVGTRACGGGG